MPYKVPRHTGLAAYPALERARASAMAGAARRAARALEQQGRGGDTHLVHVNDRELAAIRGAFGPGGSAGKHNPVTGLESFAPDEGTNGDDPFIGTNPDSPVYTMRPPLDTVPPELAAAAEFNLTSLKPRESEQTTPIQDQIPASSALAGSPLFPISRLGGEVAVAAASQPEETAARQLQSSASDVVPRPADLPDGAVAVVRPDGRTLLVRNEKDEETELLSPKADLSDVAAAGGAMRQTYEGLLNSSDDPSAANIYRKAALFTYLGHGGLFDYQREGNQIKGNLAEIFPWLTKFKQHPAYQPVSNFNVGLFSQQAGVSLEETLRNASWYAEHFSGNYMPDQPDGLDPKVRTYIIQGWKAGEQGIFDPPSDRPDTKP